jgi:hypothetical protein
MGSKLAMVGIAAALAALPGYSIVSWADSKKEDIRNMQVGPRPYFLVDDMDPAWCVPLTPGRGLAARPLAPGGEVE